jgi:hypothetical protein
VGEQSSSDHRIGAKKRLRDREFWRAYRPDTSHGPILSALKVSTPADWDRAFEWAQKVGYSKSNLKKLKVQKGRMERRNSWRELKWIIPEESPDPPNELKRLFIQASEPPAPPQVEDVSRGPYSDDDIDFILSSIKFGKQLTPEELKEIKELVVKRIAAFSRDDAEMGYTTLIECEIDPMDTTPVQIRPYKLSFEEQREAAKIVEQLLKEKAIARSQSDWAAPAFLVPKPGGGWRLVTDLRILNSRCRDWKMPLPAIEDVFQKLGNAGLFCVMDITKGFWNVPIAESSRKYTAFTLRNIGLFEYLVMPMGLKNSLATFVRLCELVFPPEDFKTFLQFFLDDLCVFCTDFKEPGVATLEDYSIHLRPRAWRTL